MTRQDPATQLKDPSGRVFRYLRLSLTERCNFRCNYCLPGGYRPSQPRQRELGLREISHLVKAFSELGISKIRLTGGEPTLRRDLLAIIESVSSLRDITQIGLTTNGFRLQHIASKLRRSGLTHLNVSVDSLNPTRFSQVTGVDRLDDVLRGIDCALEAGFPWVKINTVLLKDMDSEDLERFFSFVRTRPVTVRFIELMQTGDNRLFFLKKHASCFDLRKKMERSGWVARARTNTDGPAVEFEHPDSVGSLGLIMPYGRDFCTTCNRLRVTARGALKLCLFGNTQHSLRHLLQRPEQKSLLQGTIGELLSKKAEAHALHSGHSGTTHNLSVIGG